MKGVIVSNLGTPDSTSVKDLKKYLDEFLMDPYVIDIPYPMRLLLIRGIILRTRPQESAEAYKKIWTERGSPLMFHTLDLAEKVRKSLPSEEYFVNVAMRYGQPSIARAVSEIKAKAVKEIYFLPLYPQFSLAATESSKQKFLSEIKKQKVSAQVKILNAFYDNEDYLECVTQSFLSRFKPEDFDHYLFSYHGVPERHVQKTDSSRQHCLVKENCCSTENENNKNCYKRHCLVNAAKITEKLGISSDQHEICFQSRLGKDPWLQPFTDKVIEEIGADKSTKKKKLGVFCPAFVADCLETLEEIGMRGNEDIQALDPEKSITLIPSINSDDQWAKCLVKWCTDDSDNSKLWESPL